MWCYRNRIGRLELGGNEALEELKCDGNELTVLDVSGLPRLRQLLCYRNALKVLDVSRNGWLERLACDKNGMTELVVGGNGRLVSLECYGNRLAAEGMERIYEALPQGRCEGMEDEKLVGELVVDYDRAGDYGRAERKGWRVVLTEWEVGGEEDEEYWRFRRS